MTGRVFLGWGPTEGPDRRQERAAQEPDDEIGDSRDQTPILMMLVPAAQMFLQRKEPWWLLFVPVSGQYTLLNRILRGDGLPLTELAQTALVPLALTVVALVLFARNWSREAVLASK